MEDVADSHYWKACRLLDDSQADTALAHLESAIAIEPRHVEALVLIGEIHVLYSDALGVDARSACLKAVRYFSRALAVEPKHAHAWAGKALALLYLGRPKGALRAAERGLFVLPLRVGYGMESEEVCINAAEALFDRKVRALLALNRRADAEQALRAGLEYCPQSEYLTRLVEQVLPGCPLAVRDEPDCGLQNH